jgi:hypothetical protein
MIPTSKNITPSPSDPALERFRDLSFPGRREPVNRTNGRPVEEATVWDEKPLHYVMEGAEREFFTISHLATALGRSVVTIRSWEHKGLMPKTPFRSPRPRGTTLPDKQPKGKRLWTREQITGILRIASEEQVILNGKPPTEHFAQRVLDMFRTLLTKDDT